MIMFQSTNAADGFYVAMIAPSERDADFDRLMVGVRIHSLIANRPLPAPPPLDQTVLMIFERHEGIDDPQLCAAAGVSPGRSEPDFFVSWGGAGALLQHYVDCHFEGQGD